MPSDPWNEISIDLSIRKAAELLAPDFLFNFRMMSPSRLFHVERIWTRCAEVIGGARASFCGSAGPFKILGSLYHSNNSSARTPWATRSRLPVSICQTKRLPSAHLISKKSSLIRHRSPTTGKVCRFASKTILRSFKLKRATLWSLANEQTQYWTFT